jgi:hypothetical protein
MHLLTPPTPCLILIPPPLHLTPPALCLRFPQVLSLGKELEEARAEIKTLGQVGTSQVYNVCMMSRYGLKVCQL